MNPQSEVEIVDETLKLLIQQARDQALLEAASICERMIHEAMIDIYTAGKCGGRIRSLVSEESALKNLGTQ